MTATIITNNQPIELTVSPGAGAPGPQGEPGPTGPAGVTELVAHAIAVKATNETVNNSTTYQNDNDLHFPIEADQTTIVSYSLFVFGNSTADIKFQVTGPSGSTVVGSVHAARSSDTVMTVSSLPAIVGASTAGGAQLCTLKATIINGATAGTVNLQWAQNTATVADTQLLAGSSLHAFRVEQPVGPEGPPGPDGPDGPPGPTAISSDAGNQAELGTDGLLYLAGIAIAGVVADDTDPALGDFPPGSYVIVDPTL